MRALFKGPTRIWQKTIELNSKPFDYNSRTPHCGENILNRLKTAESGSEKCLFGIAREKAGKKDDIKRGDFAFNEKTAEKYGCKENKFNVEIPLWRINTAKRTVKEAMYIMGDIS